jgi:hypothetical protein
LYPRVLTLHDIQAFLILVALWAYSIGVCLPPFFGWGGYSAEGLLLTCSYDYLKEVINHFLFVSAHTVLLQYKTQWWAK